MGQRKPRSLESQVSYPTRGFHPWVWCHGALSSEVFAYKTLPIAFPTCWPFLHRALPHLGLDPPPRVFLQSLHLRGIVIPGILPHNPFPSMLASWGLTPVLSDQRASHPIVLHAAFPSVVPDSLQKYKFYVVHLEAEVNTWSHIAFSILSAFLCFLQKM
jgi:hypothetical protein